MWLIGWATPTDSNLKKHSDMITVKKATKKEAAANAKKMKAAIEKLQERAKERENKAK
jgi:hypothetical protein